MAKATDSMDVSPDRTRRRLTFTLATWWALWDLLERLAARPDDVNRTTGAPFTDNPGEDLALRPSERLSTGPVPRWESRRPATRNKRLLRTAAALLGGCFLARERRLTGCRLGLSKEVWRLFVA